MPSEWTDAPYNPPRSRGEFLEMFILSKLFLFFWDGENSQDAKRKLEDGGKRGGASWGGGEGNGKEGAAPEHANK